MRAVVYLTDMIKLIVCQRLAFIHIGHVGITGTGAIHYGDIIMGPMGSQITSLTIVYSGDREFPHKGPITRKMFPFDDVVMEPLL